jgi:molybdenum cofactor cytidylyltransferase
MNEAFGSKRRKIKTGVLPSHNRRSLAVIVLAAGQSRRMGVHKLLMPFGKGVILTAVLENIIASAAGEIYLITGYGHENVVAAIKKNGLFEKIQIIYNPLYETGQSSSVKRGIGVLPLGFGAMFALGDQPLVTASLYSKVAAVYAEGAANIVFPVDEEGRRGNPVVFAPQLFPDIMKLNGDRGPRALIAKYDFETVLTAEKGPFCDIDTREEYENSLKGNDV